MQCRRADTVVTVDGRKILLVEKILQVERESCLAIDGVVYRRADPPEGGEFCRVVERTRGARQVDRTEPGR